MSLSPLRLVIDMNLSPEWAAELVRSGYESVHWSTIGDPRATDIAIMAWARANDRAVFTHNLDFGTLLALTHANGPSVFQVRGQNVLPEHMGSLVIAALRQHEAALTTRAEQLQIHQKLQMQLDTAINAGCEDPSILTIQGLLAADSQVPADKVFSWFERALKSAADNKADPYTKVIIDGRILRGYVSGLKGPITPNLLQEMNFLVVDIVNKYQKAAAVPGINAAALIAMAENVRDSCQAVKVKSDWLFNGIYPSLERTFPNEAGVLKFKGAFNIDYAWEARGGGLANTVTPQMFKDFSDRLDVASAALTKAWELDPSDPTPPTLMLNVQIGQDNGDAVMETWFKRAMDINPDNLDACDRKRNYLEPKWHGSPEALLKFGHECYDSGNWIGRLPLELLDVHYFLSAYAADPNAYYEQDAVWKDHEDCYTTYLKLYPDSVRDRTNFAVNACFACRWKKADELFKELGNKAVPTALVGKDAARLKKLQKMAAEKAAG